VLIDDPSGEAAGVSEGDLDADAAGESAGEADESVGNVRPAREDGIASPSVTAVPPDACDTISFDIAASGTATPGTGVPDSVARRRFAVIPQSYISTNMRVKDLAKNFSNFFVSPYESPTPVNVNVFHR
jgi:hypothetical protein